MEIKIHRLDENRLEVTLPNASIWEGIDFFVWMAQNELTFDVEDNDSITNAIKEANDEIIVRLRKEE